MKSHNFFKSIFLLYSLFLLINCSPKQPIFSMQLNVPEKGSLNDNSYIFYKLTLNEIPLDNLQNLILRADEDKVEVANNSIQYHFSDPDIFVSQTNEYPKNPETSTWYCNEFGNDIVAISREYVHTNSTFYISVFCKKKCKFILNSYLSVSYQISSFKIYNIHIYPKKSMVYQFKTQSEDFHHLSIQIMGLSSNQYNVYINKEIPSSSNSYTLEPAWFNGYSYDLYKDSPEYCTNCTFYILVKALDKDVFFRILITYRDHALFIRKGASLFDTIKGQKNRCYFYPMDNFPERDSLIMNFFLFGGSLIAKIFGFDSVENKTYSEIVNTDNTYEIIGDRVLIFSQEQIKQFKNESISKNYKYFHFCLYSKIKSSYLLGMHFSSFSQQMQGLNFLNIGQSIKDYLPVNQITKYKLFDLSFESNIKISLEILQGSPKVYFMHQPLPFYIHKYMLASYKQFGLILQPKIAGEKQTIFIKNEENKCHERAKLLSKPGEVNRKPCLFDIIVECNPPLGVTNTTDIKNDCIYKLSTIADKSKQPINQRTTYRGLLSKDDYNEFLFRIDDENVIKFTIVLNTVSGELKLELYQVDNNEETRVFIGSKTNKDFLPKIITIQKNEDSNNKKKNLKGKYLIKVYSTTFSSYTLYYHTYTNSTDNQIDLYSIDLNLINGQMIQDFFDNKIFKVYNYEINEGNFKDIRITITQRNLDLNIFIYDNVNKISYDLIDRDQNDINDIEYMKDYDKIINFKNYLWTNLYGMKQVIIPYEELSQKVKKDKTLLFIVIAKKYYSSKNKNNEISFLNQDTFYLGVTNNIAPLNLYENIPHQATLNHLKNFSEQKYNFVHSDNNKKLSFAINVIAGTISFQIEIKKNKIIYYKNDYINQNEFITISSPDLFKYCQNTGCEFILTITQISKESPTYMIFAHSNTERPLQLSPGILLQNQIQAGEYQFYILDFNPMKYDNQNKLGNILMRFRGGKAELYMKFYSYDVEPEIENFPDENNYDYIGESTYAGKILHLDKDLYDKCISGYNIINKQNNKNNITLNDNNNQINCRFFLTVKGTELSFYKGMRIEYSLFYSHSVLEIGQGVPYTTTITAGEINYYKFSFDSNTKGIYITLYSVSGDADIYVNYGNNLPSFNNYIWRSSQSKMDSIFIDLNDNYFVDNKMTSLEGLYTIMVYGYTTSTYTLTVSQGQHKIIQLVPGIPSLCKVDEDNKEKLCYFRVENFANSKKILEEDAGGLSNIIQKSIDVVENDIHIVFSTKFIYGEGNIFVKLFKKSEIDIKLEDFPNEKNNDYTNDLSNNLYGYGNNKNNNNAKRNFLKIDIEKDNPKLSPYSMLLLSVKCKDKCLFEINSAKIEYDTKFHFIEIGRENLYYINTQKKPLLLSFLYKNKEILNYEFYSFTGNAEVKIFNNESYYDKATNKTNFEFNHIANFKIEKNIPYYNYFSEINKKNKDINTGINKEIFVQITPEKSYHDLGFYVKLNYENEWTKIENLGKIITYQLNSNTFNGYIDVYNEYQNIILSIRSDDPKLTANVYVTINEIIPFSKNQKQEYNYPTNQSYTYTGKTNYLTSTVSIKIDIANKEKSGNIFRIFYKVELTGDFSHRNSNLAKTIGVLVTPQVNNLQRIETIPYTIYYNNQDAKNEKKSIFDLKRVDNKDDIFVIEISACKGQFDADLMNQINYFNDEKDGKKINIDKKYQQGRLILTGHDLKDENYYLGIWGVNDKENNNNDDPLKKSMNYSNEVEYLLYYFTTNNKNYVSSNVESYINPTYLSNGEVKLEISKMKIKNSEGNLGEIKNVDLSYQVVVSTDINDFSYMSSLCYLSKMNKTKGIESYVKNNEIYIKGLKSSTKYFINIIIRNPISGELITLTPTIIETKKYKLPLGYIISAAVIAIILVAVICYYRSEYLVTKAVLNYEQKDVRNMDNLPYEAGSSTQRGMNSAVSAESKSSTHYINLDESKIYKN